MLYPVKSSPAHSKDYAKKKHVTKSERIDNCRLAAKRRQKRHDALFNRFISPAAAFMGRLGLVHPHMGDPQTKTQIKRYVDECNALFYHSVWAKPSEYTSVMDGPPQVIPELPHKMCHQVEDPGFRIEDGMVKLMNQRVISVPKLKRWFTHGFTRFMFKVIEERSIKRCNGEWSLMYPYEVKEAFPNLVIAHCYTRIEYLVLLSRNRNGVISEIGFYSNTYSPLFRLEIELDNSVIPDACKKWWNSRDVPLPSDKSKFL